MSPEQKQLHEECYYDPGGYFIYKGTEKVMVGQERSASNHINVFRSQVGNELWRAEVRSVANPIIGNTTVFSLKLKIISKKPKIFFRIKEVDKELPLVVLLKALGAETDQEIIECITERTLDQLQ